MTLEKVFWNSSSILPLLQSIMPKCTSDQMFGMLTAFSFDMRRKYRHTPVKPSDSPVVMNSFFGGLLLDWSRRVTLRSRCKCTTTDYAG